ncbi:2-succinyl-5-enolpyruvyl-6-hydroxy-3-cyclohexene-1-carboxylate synthase [Arthrobacter sp. CAN_A6]|uniref:2-succinyl-5-enolpyruvyl-6-hydroxy-3- cyclohexene-1-carboxylic-acid synthase n=1 Tax=Arthrobacter sp. CAN_A6 TaxID=2787721 RepID=UPI0018CA2C42
MSNSPSTSGSLSAIEAARRFVAALISGGVRDVVVAPGSRSAPLAYALAEAGNALRLHVRIDERVAGFTALGLALGAQRPVAVMTTSGTAVGELMPAVMEANHAAVPLLVLSADRPEELRGTGANQTTVQPGLFGIHVRFSADVPAGTDPVPSVVQALARAGGSAGSAGPVHLNLAFRDPLVPGPADALPPAGSPEPVAGLATGLAIGHEPESVGVGATDGTTAGGHASADTLEPTAIAALAPPGGRAGTSAPATAPTPATALSPRELPEGATTVVVAGHGAGELAAVFAAHLRLPLFAEPSSNARFGSSAIAPYRLLLEHAAGSITKVVVFGRPTLSRPVAALLARHDVEQALYLPAPVAWFEEGRRHERIIDNLPELLRFAGRGANSWLDSWRKNGAAAEAAIQNLLAGETALNGLHVADAVWENTDGNLVIGSSNPIRDLDLVAPTDWHPLDVFANRGLAGIDGTISTATGVALARGIPTRLLVGDLTFLHDVGGLLIGAGEPQPDLQIVVLNDGGGGIFGLLEHGAETTTARYGAAVERLFGTPQTVDLAAVAAAYGLRYERVPSLEGLDAAMERPIEGRSIVEIRSGRSSLRDLHARIRQAVAGAVDLP